MKRSLVIAVMILCVGCLMAAGQRCLYANNKSVMQCSSLDARYEVAPGMRIATNTVHQIFSMQ